MKIQIVNKMLNDFPHLQGIKGIKQFFLNDLHIIMERKDLKGDFDWFDKMYEKGWKPCMDAHREGCRGVLLFTNYDEWVNDIN
eukprot:SAG11_NODE_1252_length_5386_cov_29.101759_1_plen_83_part_00